MRIQVKAASELEPVRDRWQRQGLAVYNDQQIPS